MNYLKSLLNKVLEFTTGLGFYGLGLLGAAVGAQMLFGWDHISSGLIGAFVFKNWAAIVTWFKGGLEK